MLVLCDVSTYLRYLTSLGMGPMERGGAMGKSYEVRCGKRLVSLQYADSAREAVIEYLRSMGCRESEMTTLSRNALDWRGAVYRAVPLGSE
jgi:hypothetical protein